MWKPSVRVPKLLCWSVALLPAAPTALARPNTTLASVSSLGFQGNGRSAFPSVSGDGRFVAFDSFASTLVLGDTNLAQDVFVHDRITRTTTRVSVSSSGAQAIGSSSTPSISADGRFVSFTSVALNLAPGDTNEVEDIFVHDRHTGATTRVSVDSTGTQGNDSSYTSSISADGRFVAFWGLASNLVPGDTNGDEDVFVHDRQTGATTRVSVDSSGAQANLYSGAWHSISADGRFVAFYSSANNLVAGDTNGHDDVFVHDRQTGATTRVSVSSEGTQSNHQSSRPSISADGRFVAFYAYASNLVAGDTNNNYDVFVHDRQSGATTRASVASSGAQGDGASFTPSISSDGRFVAFESDASTLVPGNSDRSAELFVRDMRTGTTTLASVSNSGTEGNDYSAYASISGDGRFVAFESRASGLVPGDINGFADVFLRDWGAPCAGDANGDGFINFADLNLVLANFGQTAPPGANPGDVNADGVVDFADLNLVLSFFGTAC